MPYHLAIDTSVGITSVGIARDGDVLSNKSIESRATQAEELSRLVDDALNEHSIELKNIETIAVLIGPGSFTGIRIGLAYAKGVNLYHKTPLVGISQLERMAYHFYKNSDSEAPIVVAQKAMRNQLYVQSMAHSKNAPYFEATSEASLIFIDDLEEYVASYNAVNIITDDKDYIGKQAADITETPLGMEDMLGLAAYKKVDSSPAIPMYIRPPDAKKASNA